MSLFTLDKNAGDIGWGSQWFNALSLLNDYGITTSNTATLSSKTLTSPTITNPTVTGGGSLTGTFTGTYTLAGTLTIASPTISGTASITADTTFSSGTVALPTITGNLAVTGGLTANGASNIKVTDTNAFVVENAGGTDVFRVDTSTPKVVSNYVSTVKSADVSSPVYNTWYDAIAIDPPTNSKGTMYLATACFNNDNVVNYRALGYIIVTHSGGAYGATYISISSNNLSLQITGTSSPMLQVKDTASGGSKNIRVSVARLSYQG